MNYTYRLSAINSACTGRHQLIANLELQTSNFKLQISDNCLLRTAYCILCTALCFSLSTFSASAQSIISSFKTDSVRTSRINAAGLPAASALLTTDSVLIISYDGTIKKIPVSLLPSGGGGCPVTIGSVSYSPLIYAGQTKNITYTANLSSGVFSMLSLGQEGNSAALVTNTTPTGTSATVSRSVTIPIKTTGDSSYWLLANNTGCSQLPFKMPISCPSVAPVITVNGSSTFPVAALTNSRLAISGTSSNSVISSIQIDVGSGYISNDSLVENDIIASGVDGQTTTYTVRSNYCSSPTATVTVKTNTIATVAIKISSTVTKQFMVYNLGVTGTPDPLTYSTAILGDLYQWGRKADGHQIRTSGTGAGPVSSGSEGVVFRVTSSSSPYDWLTPQNDSRWSTGTNTVGGGVKTANDPCPTGFRLPTQAEWQGVKDNNSWTWDASGGYKITNGANTMFLPAAGYRDGSNGSLNNVGTLGYYLSSSVTGILCYKLIFSSGSITPADGSWRVNAFSLRCMAE